MIVSTLLSGLIGFTCFATALPLSEGEDYMYRTVPGFPRTSDSKGFKLVINVTDPSRDFTPPIHHQYISDIYVGVSSKLLGINPPNKPIVFYQNGTWGDIEYSRGQIMTDSGLIQTPYGMWLTPDQGSWNTSTAYLQLKEAQVGISLVGWTLPIVVMAPESYAICNQTIPQLHDEHRLILKQFKTIAGRDGIPNTDTIPKNCVPIKLMPECAVLRPLDVTSISSHKFAYKSRCYTDVAGIDWNHASRWIGHFGA